eukprot:s350_g26.t1
MAALDLLLEKGVKVHLLSFCGRKQKKKVELEMWDKLPQLDSLEWWGTCHARTGEDGKAQYACQYDCTVAFDDSKDILQELNEWGVKVYGVTTPREPHSWLPSGRKFGSFAECVEQFIKDRPETP